MDERDQGVLIFTHGDTDGVCAGALAQAAIPEAEVFFTNPYRLLEDLRTINKFERVIICDVSLIEHHLAHTLQMFSKLVTKFVR